ncbi:MAG: 5-formyltetrahydrofolate cyclo-ligase [Acidimicrobiia bacterium]
MTKPKTKSEWRRWAETRSQEVDWAAAGLGIRAGLTELLRDLSPSLIVTYLAIDREVDVEPLVADFPQHSFLVTRTPPEGPLTVHPYGSTLEQHPYGFRQPTSDSASADISAGGLALVPGLVFDRTGGRLGRGKGYFDELLGRFTAEMFIGVIPEALVVPELPTDPHDIRMTHLATEAGVRRVSRPPLTSR